MSPSRRRLLGSLVAVALLVVLAVLYVKGVLPLPQAWQLQPASKPLCYVSPKDPTYIKPEPGKDPEGHELVPVYPTQPGAKPAGPAVAPPAAERKIKYWVSSMDPKFVSDKPGKDPMGMDLVPVYEEAPAAAAPAAPTGATGATGRKIKYWVSPMDPG